MSSKRTLNLKFLYAWPWPWGMGGGITDITLNLYLSPYQIWFGKYELLKTLVKNFCDLDLEVISIDGGIVE